MLLAMHFGNGRRRRALSTDPPPLLYTLCTNGGPILRILSLFKRAAEVDVTYLSTISNSNSARIARSALEALGGGMSEVLALTVKKARALDERDVSRPATVERAPAGPAA
jgi:hypothetical protein